MSDLLTAKQVAEKWGKSVGLIYKLAKSGKLGCVRFGRSYAFHPDHLDEYIRRNSQCPYTSAANAETPSDASTTGSLSSKSRGKQYGGQLAQSFADELRSSNENSEPTTSRRHLTVLQGGG